MKLTVSIAEVYSYLEDEIKVVQKIADSETDEILKNELRELKGFLTQAMLRARQCADIKMRLSREAAINIKGKR